MPKPFYSPAVGDCTDVRDFYRSDHPEFNRLIMQNLRGLQQSGDTLAEINQTKE